MENSQLGSKDNPILISNQESLKILKGFKWITFNCRNCNQSVIVQWRYDRKKSFECLLCKNCKTKQTNIKTYGVEYTLQDKNIRQNIIETCRKIYGTDYACQNEKVKEKIINAHLEKYGVTNYTKTKDYIIKSKETYRLKYGVDNFTKTKEYKEKEIQTNLAKFGVSYASQSQEIKDKVRKTFLEKFGTTNFYLYHKYFYDNEYFDSSWELAFWIYNKYNNIDIKRNNIGLEYFFENKKHLYYPDFIINETFYEIKGDMFFENDKMINPFDRTQDDFFEAKHQCGINNNVIFIRLEDMLPILNFIDNTFGENYLVKFKI